MFAAGVDFITSGNHIWDKREFRGELDETDRIIRPANYPPGSPGRGSGIVDAGGVTVGVLNVMGRVFMPTVDDPFRVAREMVDMLREQTHVVVVDVHAEATSEKMALAPLPRRLRFRSSTVRTRTCKPPTSRSSPAARPTSPTSG